MPLTLAYFFESKIFLNLSFIDSVASKSSYSLITIMKNCIAQKSRITITMCGVTTLQMKSRTYATNHPTYSLIYNVINFDISWCFNLSF